MTFSARWFLLVLVAFFGVLCLFNAPPAQAQTVTLVSNVGQDEYGTQTIQRAGENEAQAFTTGANSKGYTLASIDMAFPTAVVTPANLRVELWSATTSGTPDSRLAELTVPSTVSGTTTFAAPSGTTLEANTRYFVAIYRSGVTLGTYSYTNSSSEDSGGQSDWSILDDLHYNDQGVWTTSGRSIRIAVKGTVVTPLSVVADPECESIVTDTSVQPSYALVLTPAPDATTNVQSRPVATDERGWRSSSLSIKPSSESSASSDRTTRNPFAHLRNVYPGFRGFEFRLANDHDVTAQCFWTFREQPPRDNDRAFNPAPPQPPPPQPTPPPPGSPTGGGPPPAEPSDLTPDSPPCGEDREDLESFYEASGGDNWHDNENWSSDKPLDEWSGVETDEDGNVISLRLEDNNLSGEMPKRQLLCLTELKELALWGNDDLSGDVPEKLVLAVERAVLRDVAKALSLYAEWFEDYDEPFDFGDWHTGVTTDDDGRVTELDFTEEEIEGEIPESVFELQMLGMISTGCGVTLEVEAPGRVSVMMPDDCAEETVSSRYWGCALGSGDSSVFGLFLLTLLVFAALGRTRTPD